MKHKIERYKYEKVLDKEYEIDLPEVPEFHFQFGIRRAIAIIPQWTTWNMEHNNKPEEIYAIDFISVYRSFDCRIEKSSINVSSLADALRKGDDHYSLAGFLEDRTIGGNRTLEQFMGDYNSAIEEMNRIIPSLETAYNKKQNFVSADHKTAISSDGEYFQVGDIVEHQDVEAGQATIQKFGIENQKHEIIARTDKGYAGLDYLIKIKKS
jgi:hypothetical protein